MSVLTVVGIAAMCFLLYKINENLETVVRRLSRIEERLMD